METGLRTWFNQSFTPEKYQRFHDEIKAPFGVAPTFRLCETPVFLSRDMKKMLLQACEEVNDTITRPDFKAITEGAFGKPELRVPNEDQHTLFLQMDFGMCMDDQGQIVPQLIELQGFPTLYYFQHLLTTAYQKAYDLPQNLSPYFNGLTADTYLQKLEKVIIGDCEREEVVLLELYPETQNTFIDFAVTSGYLGIKILCITKVIKRERSLYYTDNSGRLIKIRRVYNRVIFDELDQQTDLKLSFSFHDDLDVEWVGHPNWFYRISKYTLPLLKSKFVPDCNYLSSYERFPDDLEHYVLKPLFSFAGSGVVLHPSLADLQAIRNPENYLLQRRVNYHPVIETPTGPAKIEVRMIMLWEQGAPRAQVINNLVRVSKGEMIGVKYNKDKDWVGASVALFEE